MSPKLAAFVAPMTEPLSEMQGHFAQLSSSLQVMDAQLQAQLALLTGNTGDNTFQGLGATTFNQTVEYYLTTASKQRSMLEEAAILTQSCNLQLLNSIDIALAGTPNEIIVNYVLNKVTVDQVVEQGSSPVETVLQELRQTLNDMDKQAKNYGKDMANAGKSLEQGFVDFFAGKFGAAGHDFQQSGKDFAQSFDDLSQFFVDTGMVVWESVFEMTAAALIQCTQDIWQAIQSLAQGFANLVATVVKDIKEFAEATWEFLKDEATFDYDMARGDYTDALLALIAAEVNPVLIMEGQQPLSQGQIQEILPPGFWQWFKNLPAWAKILAIVVVVVVVVGVLIWGAISGGGSGKPPYTPPEGQVMDPQKAAKGVADAAYQNAEQYFKGKGKQKKDKNQSNYGGGYLEVLGKPSKEGQTLTGKPLLQKPSGLYIAEPGDIHVEQQVVEWAIRELESSALPPTGANSVYAVRLMIYTYKSPCAVCSGNLHGIWQRQVWEAARGAEAAAVGKTILVIFAVYSSNAGAGSYGKPTGQTPFPTPGYPA
jgi:hypothetical protein